MLEGSLNSGEGKLLISGEGGLAADAPMTISLKGEQFLAADIPAARVVISPDLAIERSSEGILVSGKLVLPAANIERTTNTQSLINANLLQPASRR